MKYPLVSVVMSAYNTEKYIVEAIESILRQDYQHLEIVIADDCSSDRTRMLIDNIGDDRIRVFHNASNMGYLATWNKLLPLTRGEYITFQDADDASHPSRIGKLVEFLEQHRDIGLCGSNFVRFFQPWGLYLESNFPTTKAGIEEAISNGKIPFAGTRVMIRREVYEKVGGFRSFFHKLTWEDYDWILRIMEHYQVANIADVLYEYRYFSSSTSKQSTQPSIEKMYVDQVGFFLAGQRKARGYDALDSSNFAEIETFLAPLRDQVALDKTGRKLHVKIFRNLLANKDYGNAFRLLSKRMGRHPFRKEHLSDLFDLVTAIMRTVLKAAYCRVRGRSRFSLNDY